MTEFTEVIVKQNDEHASSSVYIVASQELEDQLIQSTISVAIVCKLCYMPACMHDRLTSLSLTQ